MNWVTGLDDFNEDVHKRLNKRMLILKKTKENQEWEEEKAMHTAKGSRSWALCPKCHLDQYTNKNTCKKCGHAL